MYGQVGMAVTVAMTAVDGGGGAGRFSRGVFGALDNHFQYAPFSGGIDSDQADVFALQVSQGGF